MKEEELFQYNFENAERIGYLVANFIKGTLTPLERKELDDWILQSQKNELLFDELTSEENVQKTMQWYAAIDEKKAMERLKQRIAFRKERRLISFPFMSIAASLIVIIGISIFFWQIRKKPTNEPAPVGNSGEIFPANGKPVLTMVDGTRVILDSTAPAALAGGAIKIERGSILYDSSVVSQPKENLLTVPRGSQFMITLADGTKAWLNAESSLRYSTSFTGNERRVTLTGEGYFEVAKNREKPFIVESSAGTVKVLGTHFEINTYGDDGILTATLLEGSVQITKGSNSKILKPGQQARVTEDKIELVPVDVNGTVAWKEGEFIFRNTPVTSIAKQLSRWYDLDVEFKGPDEKHLNATIKRDVPLSKVLHYLEQTGDVHFKVEGRKLLVLK